MGMEAARMLVEILKGEKDGKQPQQKVFEPELIVRESCGSKQQVDS
jgi:DNA-binding LacI/PurR family transcriptional regulator